MKKLVVTVGVLCCLFNIGYCSTTSLSDISNIEVQVFGYEYKNDSEVNRINRIEKFLYGKNSPGNIELRVKKINTDLGLSTGQKIANAADSVNKTKKPAVPVYEKEDPSVQYPIVDKIEAEVFKRNFNGENIYARLDRLEKKVYSKVSDEELSNRVNKLRLSVLDKTPNVFDTETYPVYSTDDEIIKRNAKLASKKSDQNYNYSSPQKSRQEYMDKEIAAMEEVILKQSYLNGETNERLTRLETKIFKRNFSNDDSSTRIERIAAATSAKKSSQMYDNNKLMRNLTTGAQVGGILLMILAMIL